MMNSFRLDGKIALVTGASYGIGYAIAKGLASAGATIVFNDINQELVDKGLAAYKADGINARGYVCDVTDEEAVQALVKTVKEEVGVIDILVNNAGIIKRIPMIEMSAADFRKVIDVDLNAPVTSTTLPVKSNNFILFTSCLFYSCNKFFCIFSNFSIITFFSWSSKFSTNTNSNYTCFNPFTYIC